jgi:hypothetical protein
MTLRCVSDSVAVYVFCLMALKPYLIGSHLIGLLCAFEFWFSNFWHSGSRMKFFPCKFFSNFDSIAIISWLVAFRAEDDRSTNSYVREVVINSFFNFKIC